jgi:hypothetical protein
VDDAVDALLEFEAHGSKSSPNGGGDGDRCERENLEVDGAVFVNEAADEMV